MTLAPTTQARERWQTAAVLAGWATLLGLGGWFVLGAFSREVRFNADAERDLMEVFAWAHFGRLPARGILHASLGVDLGPAYFALLAPINLLWTSPMAVHVLNATLFLGGISLFALGLGRLTSPVAGLVAAFLYAVSEANVALLSTAYHVGATSGLSVGFLGAAFLFSHSGRRRWLFTGVALLALLMQLHIFGWLYAAFALCVLIQRRRELNGPVLFTLLGVFAALLLPMGIYLIRGFGDPNVAGAGHAGAMGFRPVEALVGVFELSRAHWLVGRIPMAILVLVTALAALVLDRRPIVRFLAAQVGLGLCAVAAVLSFETSARYWLAAMPAVFALAAFGLQRVALYGRWAPVAMATALLVGALLSPPPAFFGAAPPEDDALVLVEQEAVVERLVAGHGLLPHELTRVHGSLLGPSSGARYLERIWRERRAGTHADGDWLVVAPGVATPELASRLLATETLSPAGRPVSLARFRPLFDRTVRGADGRTCSGALPYVWSQQTTSLLQEIGFATGHGPDLHRCLESGSLWFSVGSEAADITVDLADDAHFRGETSPVGVVVDGAPVIPSESRLRDRVRRIVRLPESANRVRTVILQPAARRVVFMDIF